MDGVAAQMRHVQVDVVLFRTAAPALFDFLVHATRNKIARRQIFQVGRVALHKPFTVGVAQNRALATAAFGQQHASARHASGMELPELHVFQGNACACCHAQTIAGVDEGIGGSRKNPSCAAGGQQGGLGLQNMHVTGFHLQRGHADHVTIGVTDQVHSQPFDKEIGVGLHVLLVQGVQHGVPCAVSCCAGALHRFFAIVGCVAAKGALVNRAVRVAVKGHAHVLKLVHHFGCFAAHEFDRVLVAQPVRPLDGVVEVVVPVVVVHIAQGRANAPLCGHRVRAGWEDLGQYSHVQAGAGQLKRGAHAGAASANHDDVKFAPGNR